MGSALYSTNRTYTSWDIAPSNTTTSVLDIFPPKSPGALPESGGHDHDCSGSKSKTAAEGATSTESVSNIGAAKAAYSRLRPKLRPQKYVQQRGRSEQREQR